MRRGAVLPAVVVGASILVSLSLIWLSVPPVKPAMPTVNVTDTVQVNLTTTAAIHRVHPKAVTGTYSPAPAPGRAKIQVAADQPKLTVLTTCSHELRHHTLTEQGVAIPDQHDVMTGYSAYTRFDTRCLKLMPHIWF